MPSNDAPLGMEQLLTTVARSIQEDVPDAKDRQSLVTDLTAMAKSNPEDFKRTVAEMYDQVKIGQYKSQDKTFSPESAFVRGMGKTMTAGLFDVGVGAVKGLASGEGVASGVRGELERSRLLAKDNPTLSTLGQLTGFGVGKGAGAQAFLAADKVAGILGQNFLVRGAATGAIGGALVEGSQALSEEGAKAAIGDETFDQAMQKVQGAAKQGAISGGTAGALFAAGGYGALQVAKGVNAVAQKGADVARQAFFGKPAQNGWDQLQLMKDAVSRTPQVVIAESAEKMAPAIREMQDKLAVIQNEARRDLVAEAAKNKIQLTGDLQQTAISLNAAVENLRRAHGEDLVAAASNLHDHVGGAYKAANSAYAQALDGVVANKGTAMANLKGPLDLVEKELRNGGMLDNAGRIISDTPWAKANPDLANELTNYWERLGGSVRAQGGADSVNTNLLAAINFKRELGEKANFGSSPFNATPSIKNYERVMRGMYNGTRQATEAVAPELAGINQAYAANRTKIDDFRNLVGKSEQQIATKLYRDLKSPKNLLLVEALEAFGTMGQGIAGDAKKALDVSASLKLVDGFKKDPKGVFTQLQQAYVSNDTFTLNALNSIAEKYPALKPYLTAAEKQSQAIAAAPGRQQVQAAFRDGQALEQLSSQLPQAGPAVARAQAAQGQSQQLQSMLPQNPMQLADKLSQPGYGAAPLEQQALQGYAGQSPAISEGLARADAARQVDKMISGHGMTPTALEQIPVIGQTIFSLRKAATPTVARFLLQVGNASEKTRNSMLSDLISKIQDVDARGAIDGLAKKYGPEAAVTMYAQQGGNDQLLRAAEALVAELHKGDPDSTAHKGASPQQAYPK
jgi:hypothetical protein